MLKRTCASVAGLALILAGCGSTGPSVARLGSGTTAGGSSPSASTGPSQGGLSESQTGGPASGGSAESHSSIGIAGATGATALKFAACVRSHGVPSFPDPSAQGTFNFTGDLNRTPQFQSATRTCSRLLHVGGGTPSPAQQAKALAGLLKFSNCMRSHGVPKFPDPTTSPGGGVGLSVNASNGVDPNSPVFQDAQRACQSLMPGAPGAAS
ncbi:MAG TPA: hypothetical protein VG165_17140 [Solirubrobacteraceae bacterium]|jgi:hypothetical protein|nr:hypothetical protein [Solirubrobacteraceae bacterium]